MSYGVREGVWVQRFLNKLLPKQVVRRMKIFGDNETSLILTKNPESQNRTKYINVMYHHVGGLVEDGKLGIKWIPIVSIFIYGLMKALSAITFKSY